MTGSLAGDQVGGNDGGKLQCRNESIADVVGWFRDRLRSAIDSLRDSAMRCKWDDVCT